MAEPREVGRANLERAKDGEELFKRAAEFVVGAASEALRERGTFSIALSGGSTPRSLYRLLADDPSLRSRIPWEKTHVFWGDERCVPPDHPDSNFKMAQEALLSKVPVHEGLVHRIRGEDPKPSRAAADYEATLRAALEKKKGVPRLDLVLLGLGPEAHTASLFPGTRALKEKSRLAVATWVGKLDAHRVTLTAPALNGARLVLFLVSGGEKALALKAVLQGPFEPEQLPAQLIRPKAGRLVFLADEAAAHLVGAPSRQGP